MGRSWYKVVSVWRTVQHAAALIGLAYVKPHHFRRFVGTQLAKRDMRVPLRAAVIGELGHAQPGKRLFPSVKGLLADAQRATLGGDRCARFGLAKRRHHLLLGEAGIGCR